MIKWLSRHLLKRNKDNNLRIIKDSDNAYRLIAEYSFDNLCVKFNIMDYAKHDIKKLSKELKNFINHFTDINILPTYMYISGNILIREITINVNNGEIVLNYSIESLFGERCFNTLYVADMYAPYMVIMKKYQRKYWNKYITFNSVFTPYNIKIITIDNHIYKIYSENSRLLFMRARWDKDKNMYIPAFIQFEYAPVLSPETTVLNERIEEYTQYVHEAIKSENFDMKIFITDFENIDSIQMAMIEEHL